jgi:hypothetical protein
MEQSVHSTKKRYWTKKEPLAEGCTRVVEKSFSFVVEASIARVAEVLLIGSVVSVSF